MRITKVYTRTGDAGQTRLAGGSQISKADLRIEAYGTIDELNAVIGMVRSTVAGAEAAAGSLDQILHQIQNRLFDAGGELATPPEATHPDQSLVTTEDVTKLEASIDTLNADLGPLTEFILPGGGPLGAAFHQARTTCRRAERRVVSLVDQDPTSLLEASAVLAYLNRLSDWLFVGGRWAAKACSEPENLWERR